MARALAKEPGDRPTAAELLELLLDTGAHDVALLSVRPEVREAARAVRRRRPRRRALLAGTAAAALALLAGAGAYALQGGDPAPVPSAAASGSPRTPIRLGDGPLIVDALDRPAQWERLSDESGKCVFEGGRLTVSTGQESLFCPGPTEQLTGDQTIEVSTALRGPASCAYVGFRRLEEQYGYALSLCRDKIEFHRDQYDTAGPIASQPTTVLADAAEHLVRISVTGTRAAASIDGRQLLSTPLDDARLSSGSFFLGLTGGGSVTYANARISTTTASDASPAVTDPSEGDTESFVAVDALQPTALAARPVLYQKTPAFCETMGLPLDDKECTLYPFGLERSQAVITIPLADDAEFLLPSDGCQDSSGTGTCPASADDFRAWVKKNSNDLIRLTTVDGTAIRLAGVNLDS